MSALKKVQRSAGVLLHLTSLPGPFGVGDLGPSALRWIDTLAAAGQSWWQMLPLGPTGYGDSPYQALSTFAGNPILINPESLAADGLAATSDVDACAQPDGPVEYEVVIGTKRRLLEMAFSRFRSNDAAALREPYRKFCASAHWLDDFALFAALKDKFSLRPWWQWDKPFTMREPRALAQMMQELAAEIEFHRFTQFLFFRQWEAVRQHALGRGVRLFGDMPIYVAEDSADVWVNPELFQLDHDRRPLLVAGVPPDYFSETGQLWGNPVYAWDVHRRTGFRWWAARLRAAAQMFDLIRIDHFRGIEGYWAVPAGESTAVNGKWLPGPGAELLEVLREALGGLPVVAEDLGVITPEVDSLRESFQLPGMRVLQFAFGGAVESRFLPHRYTGNLLVTTGTHDNDTTRGWTDKLALVERQQFEAYVPEANSDPVWGLLRTAWASVADLAFVPMQDLLGLGSEARLNTPGTPSGNWRWRVRADQLSDPTWATRLAGLTRVYERAVKTID